MNKKLIYLIYNLIINIPNVIHNNQRNSVSKDHHVKQEEHKFLQTFQDSIFLELTTSIDAKQCAQSMFTERFERIDMDFLNSNNIYQYHFDS